MANKVYTFLERKDPEQMRLFGEACLALKADGISIFASKEAAEGDDFSWIQEIFGQDLWEMTWITVIPCPTFPQFMLDILQTDKVLLTRGIGGSPAHKTSLLRRILVPLDGVKGCFDPYAVKGDPYQVPTPPTGQYEGPDFQRHVPGEPFPTPIVPEAVIKGPVPVSPPASQSPDLDAFGLTTDEKEFARLMLTGIAMQVVANQMGVSWGTATGQLNPSVTGKFKAGGVDFKALVTEAKRQRKEEVVPV